MIQLNHVTKLYGSVIGANDVTLSLGPGAHGLLGPNGSGKTTLLNLICGQLRPTLGSVRVRGQSPWNNPALFRDVGVCPEQDVLYPNVTGYVWVRYLLELNGMGRREAGLRAKESLDRVGIADAMHRKIGGYSRGMRQRAKLAQALAHEPDLLILDEPLNGLDPVARHQITEILREWIRRGKSLVMASHILHEVEAITRSFLLICGSRLLASGPADEMHALLADVPSEIRIRSAGASRLARRLVEEEDVEAIRFIENGDVLAVSTRSPARIYAGLPDWIDETGIRVDEMQSTDESLQSLFHSLLRIHKGMS
jgi:ABC-2 type transport system ATP-binding protein